MIIFIAILGAIMNRIRGGWLTDIFRKKGYLGKDQEIPFVRDLNAIVFSITFTIILGADDSFRTLAILAILYLSIRLAFSFGWGGYITSIIDKEIDHNRDDVELLDKWFRGDDVPVLSGWAALTLRGFLLTFCLFLGFVLIYLLGVELSPKFVFLPLVGFAMGTIYLLSCLICERVTFRGNGWQWGEIVFGGYLWAMTFLLVG